MWKLIAVVLGIGVAFVAGTVLGDRSARHDFASALERVETMSRQSLEATQQFQGNAERAMTVESLALAKMLRDSDVDGALARIEGNIESLRAAIEADAGSPRSIPRDADILRSVAEYQASYPWVPPPPDPAALAFERRFGRLAPHIQDGAVIGFRVQPGSELAQVGVVNGDIITHYDGQPVSLERRPSLYEALQSGSRVELVVRTSDGVVRTIQVPQQ